MNARWRDTVALIAWAAFLGLFFGMLLAPYLGLIEIR